MKFLGLLLYFLSHITLSAADKHSYFTLKEVLPEKNGKPQASYYCATVKDSIFVLIKGGCRVFYIDHYRNLRLSDKGAADDDSVAFLQGDKTYTFYSRDTKSTDYFGIDSNNKMGFKVDKNTYVYQFHQCGEGIIIQSTINPVPMGCENFTLQVQWIPKSTSNVEIDE